MLFRFTFPLVEVAILSLSAKLHGHGGKQDELETGDNIWHKALRMSSRRCYVAMIFCCVLSGLFRPFFRILGNFIILILLWTTVTVTAKSKTTDRVTISNTAVSFPL